MIADTAGNCLIDPSRHTTHTYQEFDWGHSFLKPETRTELEKFLVAFQDFRSVRNDRILDATLYPNLPYTERNPETWKNRQKDLKYLQKEHSVSGQRILEIGSWNGWLANRLTLGGASVCAIDYFIDPFDGLGATSHFPNSNWTAIQMDCEDLSILEPGFDFIIFNWNIMMFSDPWKTIDQAKRLLGKNGVIIILGVIVVWNKTQAEKHFSRQSLQFEKEYGIPIELRPFKGFFMHSELRKLRKIGFETMAYQGIKTKVKGLLKPSSGQVYRAVFNQNQ